MLFIQGFPSTNLKHNDGPLVAGAICYSMLIINTLDYKFVLMTLCEKMQNFYKR